jgi:hypothetical protein
MRMASVSERGDKDRLNRVHPILRLFECDIHFRFEDVFGDLHSIEPKLLVDLSTYLGFKVVKRW